VAAPAAAAAARRRAPAAGVEAGGGGGGAAGRREGRAISNCHFAVQLNQFIPILSYSVAVF
jgi:hypothetical protein